MKPFSLWRLLGRLLFALGILVAVVAGVVVFNAWRTVPIENAVPPATSEMVDARAAALRLGEAIRFPTLSKIPGEPINPGSFLSLHAFMERSYPAVHRRLHRDIIGSYSLLFRWDGSDKTLKPLLLMGHMDVVPGTDNWMHPPFSGEITEEYVWGRGSLDDKVSVFGLLEAVEYLLVAGFQPRRTIYLAFGHDEEIDGRNGARRIVAHLKEAGVRIDTVLDEGSPIVSGIVPGIDAPVALIGTAEKGYLSVELIARTPGGHSSMPSPNTAIMLIAKAVQQLGPEALPASLRPPMSQTLNHLAPHFSFMGRLIIANRWLTKPLLLSEFEKMPETNAMIRTTAAATVIHAGEKDNVLPAEARAVVNLRLLPGDSVSQTMTAIRAALAGTGIEVLQYGEANEPSRVSDPESASYRRLSTTIRQIFPDVIVAPALVIAATDSRHYAEIADNVYRFLPTRLGPEDMSRMHGTDERIAIRNYGEIIRFYIQCMRNFAG